MRKRSTASNLVAPIDTKIDRLHVSTIKTSAKHRKATNALIRLEFPLVNEKVTFHVIQNKRFD